MPDTSPGFINSIINAISVAPTLDRLQSLTGDAWETAAITAIAVGMAPLLHWRLQSLPVALPPGAQAKLALTHQAHARRNQAIAGQLSELLTAFAAAGIPVLTLKGALLAPLLYPDPALRPMNDIDLLFRPADLPAAARVLENLGYQGHHKSADEGAGVVKHLSTYRRPGNHAGTPNPFLSAASDRMVEPHSSLEESWFGLRVDITPGVWERAVPIMLHQQPTFRLSNEDMLLHLAVHAVFHVIMGRLVFLQLYDIGQVIQAWGNQLNWMHLLNLARQTRAEPFLYTGLFWARRLYGFSLPDSLLPRLEVACPPRLRAYIHSLDAAAIFRRAQQPPLVTLTQRLRRGLSDRRESARWAGSWAGKWRVWQTALTFYKTDTVRLLLKRGAEAS